MISGPDSCVTEIPTFPVTAPKKTATDDEAVLLKSTAGFKIRRSAAASFVGTPSMHGQVSSWEFGLSFIFIRVSQLKNLVL